MKDRKTEILENSYIGEKCVKYVHKSGLEVYITEKEFSGYYAIFGTRYGSYDNKFKVDGKEYTVPAGIAHFLEHKMFESPEGTDAFEEYAAIGADANAYTSIDRTAYLFSCTENFYEALRTLIKMVLTPHFTEENVAKEQGIIGQEIKMSEDRAGSVITFNLFKAMYETNPIRIPIAGTIDSIAEITPELLYHCYNIFYRMNNMALCICGKVDADQVLDIVDEMIPEEAQSEVAFEVIDEPAEVYQKRISAEFEVSRPIFRIGVKFPEAKSEDETVCDILWEALFGESEDFYQDVYESGLVSGYSNYYDFCRVCSYFVVGGNSDDPEAVYTKFCEYAENKLKNDISEESVELAKRTLYSECVSNFESSENIAENMFESFLVGERGLDKAEAYAAVTYEQVSEMAKRVLDERRFALSVIYPKNR